MEKTKEVNEKLTLLREMYKEAFPLDSDKYLDYFFEKKLKQSGGGFIYKEYNQLIPSMMTIVKKQLVFKDIDDLDSIEKIINSFCVVAVATKKEYRQKGYMTRLFNEVLFEQLGKTEIPFIMLFTDKPSFYYQYGFGECFSYHELNKKELTNDIELVPTGAVQQLIKIYNQTINAEIKTFRNTQTLSNRLDELMYEDGKAYLIKYKGKTKGYCLISGNNEEIDEIIYDGDYEELEHSKIADYKNVPLYSNYFGDTNNNGFMIKIIDAIEFFKLVKFKIENATFKFKLRRRGIGDINLEIEIKNHRAINVTELKEDLENKIDETDVIYVLRGGKSENKFLSSIEPMDMFFLEKF